VDVARYIDPSVIRFLPEIAWLALAPLLALTAYHWNQRYLGFLAPVAAAWAIWRCAIPAVVLPYALGGFAGLVMTPIACLAMVGYAWTAARTAKETPEVAIRTRHGLVVTGFTLVFISLGAIAAVMRLSSLKPV
jgi:hypothetical protein